MPLGFPSAPSTLVRIFIDYARNLDILCLTNWSVEFVSFEKTSGFRDLIAGSTRGIVSARIGYESNKLDTRTNGPLALTDSFTSKITLLSVL